MRRLTEARTSAAPPYEGTGVSRSRSAEPSPPRCDPARAVEVAGALLDYLNRRIPTQGLRYVAPPVAIPNGWEAYTYSFQLGGPETFPDRLAGPLVARIYSCPEGLGRARHEFAVQRLLGRFGYPVAEPILLEESSDLFGGPFLLVEWVPGQTLYQVLYNRPSNLWQAPAQMAALHARLHRLSADDFPAPAGELLARSLDYFRSVIGEHNLAGLAPGLGWLVAHRPEPAPRPSIVHLDFHPMNLIYGADQSFTLLDWTESDVGDYHADVAATLVYIECPPFPRRGWYERLLMPVAQFRLRRGYVRAYRRHAPLDREKLNYYRAWAAFRWLCRHGHWLHAGPTCTGSKASSLRFLSAFHFDALARYFQKYSGVRIYLA